MRGRTTGSFWKTQISRHIGTLLARPDFTKPFTIQCHASSYALGEVITQEGDDGEHPLYYIGRTLADAERIFSTTKKECLQISALKCSKTLAENNTDAKEIHLDKRHLKYEDNWIRKNKPDVLDESSEIQESASGSGDNTGSSYDSYSDNEGLSSKCTKSEVNIFTVCKQFHYMGRQRWKKHP